MHDSTFTWGRANGDRCRLQPLAILLVESSYHPDHGSVLTRNKIRFRFIDVGKTKVDRFFCFVCRNHTRNLVSLSFVGEFVLRITFFPNSKAVMVFIPASIDEEGGRFGD